MAADLAASSSSAPSADTVGKAELEAFVTAVEQRLAGLEAAAPEPGPILDPQGSYVSNCGTGTLHWTRAGPGWAAHLQTTRGCGWKFMNRRFERLSTVPLGTSWKSVCDRCLPLLRSELLGDDVSDMD